MAKGKNKYQVTIPVAGHVTVTVSANNKKEAIDKALGLVDISDKGIIEELQTYEKLVEGNIVHVSQYETTARICDPNEETVDGVEYVERLHGYNRKSCPGIPLGDGNFSGCSGGKDCPVCGGDGDWLEKLINRKLEADRPSDAEFYIEIQVAADNKEKLFETLRGISSYMPLYTPMIEGTKKEVQQEEFAYRIDIVNWSGKP